MIDLEKIIHRFKEFRGVKTQKKIAEELGISDKDFSNRKKRGTLLPLIIEMAVNQSVDMHWLLTGERSMITGTGERWGNTSIANGHIAVASSGDGNYININGEDATQLGEGVQLLQKILQSGNKELINMTLTNLKITAAAAAAAASIKHEKEDKK